MGSEKLQVETELYVTRAHEELGEMEHCLVIEGTVEADEEGHLHATVTESFYTFPINEQGDQEAAFVILTAAERAEAERNLRKEYEGGAVSARE